MKDKKAEIIRLKSWMFAGMLSEAMQKKRGKEWLKDLKKNWPKDAEAKWRRLVE